MTDDSFVFRPLHIPSSPPASPLSYLFSLGEYIPRFPRDVTVCTRAADGSEKKKAGFLADAESESGPKMDVRRGPS